MQEHHNEPNITVNSEVIRPRRRSLKLIVLVALTVLLLTSGCGVGAWFGGQWAERREWEAKYGALQIDNQALNAANDQLNEGYQALNTTYADLSQDYQILEADNAQLTEDNAWYLSVCLEYIGIAAEVNRRLGDSCEDVQSFITPTDADVAARVMAIAGAYSSDVNGRWSDYYALYNWVVGNIEYSYDTPLPQLPPLVPDLSQVSWQEDYWRTPNETLEDGRGDCEDMACLLTSMLKNYTQGTTTFWVIIWSSDNSGHAAVAFPVQGGYLTILDPAGNYHTGYPGYKDISTAVADWLALWPSEPGIHVSAVFSDTESNTFATSAEFVDWAVARAA